MTNTFTDEQIARVLTICNTISLIQRELPAPPSGFDTSLEIAHNLRASLERREDLLLELAAILVPGHSSNSSSS